MAAKRKEDFASVLLGPGDLSFVLSKSHAFQPVIILPQRFYFQKKIGKLPPLQLNASDSSKRQVQCKRYMPESLIQ